MTGQPGGGTFDHLADQNQDRDEGVDDERDGPDPCPPGPCHADVLLELAHPTRTAAVDGGGGRG